jgi:hypothetical protein
MFFLKGSISFLFVVMILATINIGCQKKAEVALPIPEPAEPVPINYPKRYIPAYPGSYWIYDTEKAGIQTTITTGPEYVLDSIVEYNTNKKVRMMVPVYGGFRLWDNGYYVQMIDKFTHSVYHRREVFLIDSLPVFGKEFSTTIPLPNSDIYWGRITICTDTNLVVSGQLYNHVIGVREYGIKNGPREILQFNDTYYAPDIGVVYSCSYGGFLEKNWGPMNPAKYVPSDSIEAFTKLKSFHINK